MKGSTRLPAWLVVSTALAAAGALYLVWPRRPGVAPFVESWQQQYREAAPAAPGSPQPELTAAARAIVEGARQRAQAGARYDARYVPISYPGGDLPDDVGACTDVVIRSFRNAGIDLQRLIHEDMAAHFDAYPKLWGLTAPDRNIDHRRTPNQMTFFQRHGLCLTLETGPARAGEWLPGDVAYWRLPSGRLHCGVLVDTRGSTGLPRVVHNLPPGCREEDCLIRWTLTGHFRYPKPPR